MTRFKSLNKLSFSIELNKAIESHITKQLSMPEAERHDIRVSDLASHFDVNTATLRRWCIELFEQNPQQYIAAYRIKKAKELLRMGFRSLEVAKKLAFKEHKTFCNVFKRVENTSASSFYQPI